MGSKRYLRYKYNCSKVRVPDLGDRLQGSFCPRACGVTHPSPLSLPLHYHSCTLSIMQTDIMVTSFFIYAETVSRQVLVTVLQRARGVSEQFFCYTGSITIGLMLYDLDLVFER